MLLSNVKRTLLKNVNITKLREMTLKNVNIFDHNWKLFIDILETDDDSKSSWPHSTMNVMGHIL